MYQLAAFTDEISQDLQHACEAGREFGVTGAEIRGVWGTNVSEITDEQVREVKRITGDFGMPVCSVASPFGKCELDSAAEWSRHLDLLRRCADIAHELDCGLVRGFVFWGHDATEKPWNAIFKAFESVPAILDEKGIILGIENEAACYVGTAADLRYFLDRMECPRLKAIWDPANHVHDPAGAAMPCYPDGYQLLRDDIIHVHVKDAAPGPDGTVQGVFMGQGIVGWERQFQALKDDGYEGFVSLETHVDPENFPEELMPAYGRYLTGEGREGASRVCLAWIRDTMAGLA